MTIEIENMRPGPTAGTVGIFDAYVDGWMVRDCVVEAARINLATMHSLQKSERR